MSLHSSQFVVHFVAEAGFHTQDHAAPSDRPMTTLESTPWARCHVAVLELLESKKFVLIAHDTFRNVTLYLTFFSSDWTLVNYNEQYNIIHWHGPEGRIDVKMAFKDGTDIRRFIQVFTAGRARMDALANREEDALQKLRQSVIAEFEQLANVKPAASP